MQQTQRTLIADVAGLPPAKSEAKSMLGRGHPHEPRVRALLRAARAVLMEDGGTGFGGALLGMEVTITTKWAPPSDATNILGGIADMLEAKGPRAPYITHLEDLAEVALYDNDRQLRELHFHHAPGERDGYTVRLWEL